MKIRFGKSEPVLHLKYWTNSFDVFVEGVKIGELVGKGSALVHVEYWFEGDHPLRTQWPTIRMPVGVRAAKRLARELLTSESNTSEG